MFDIRPCIWNGEYYTGHFGKVFEEFQGGTCQSIKEIVQQVNDFAKSHSELIILDLSHDMNCDQEYRCFNKDDWDGLLTLLDDLKYLYLGTPASNDLSNVKISDFLCSNQNPIRAAVVIRVPFGDEDTAQHVLGVRAGKGYFYHNTFPDYYDNYSNDNRADSVVDDQLAKLDSQRPSPDKPMFCLGWAMTMQTSNIANVDGGLRDWAARYMNPRFAPKVMAAVTKQKYPNVISMDGSNSTVGAAVALAINCLAAS